MAGNETLLRWGRNVIYLGAYIQQENLCQPRIAKPSRAAPLFSFCHFAVDTQTDFVFH